MKNIKIKKIITNRYNPCIFSSIQLTHSFCGSIIWLIVILKIKSRQIIITNKLNILILKVKLIKYE